MGLRLLTLLSTASLGWCAQPQVPAAEAGGQRIFTRVGYVTDGEEQGGRGWFRLEDPEQRFRLPEGSAGSYWELVSAASERGVVLHVRYDGAAGEVHSAEGYVVYPICTLAEGEGRRIGGEAENCPARAGSAATESEARLALALAHAPANPARARRLLDAALAGGGLTPALRAVALKTRGAAAEARAEAAGYPGDAYDRALADALADYRGWAAAAPDELEAQYAVARALAGLGGDGEALRRYAAILRRWPDEAYNVAVRSGAVFRQRGDHSRALRQLDEFAARASPEPGMRFHYHRGWTLALLGRDREAAEEFTEGLTTQPDYAYAHLRRSCAYARQGRIADSLGDARRGLALLRAMRDLPAPSLAEEIGRAEAAVGSLQASAAAGLRTAGAAPCEVLDDRGQRPRPRSRLLGAAR